MIVAIRINHLTGETYHLAQRSTSDHCRRIEDALGCHRTTVKAVENADIPAAVQSAAAAMTVVAVDVAVVVGEDVLFVVCCWTQTSRERSDCDWETAGAGSEEEVEEKAWDSHRAAAGPFVGQDRR